MTTEKIDRQAIAETIERWAQQLEEEAPLLLTKLEKLALTPEVEPRQLLREVLKFLWLVSQSKRSLTPSHTVDLGWHEFILFTKAYARFCEQQLGRFIHHTPDDNQAQSRNRFSQTVYRYSSVFGQPPEAIWGADAKREWEDLNCGSCSTS